MSITREFEREIKTVFDRCKDHTSSLIKKKQLSDVYKKLLEADDDKSAYMMFYEAINDRASEFSKAIDIKTGFGKVSSASSKTRTEMEALQRSLEFRLEGNDMVSLGLMKDSKGHGLAKVMPSSGTKNAIHKAYVITPSNESALNKINSALKVQEKARFIAKGDLFNIYNKAGLDYKGQANYVSLTLLKGIGLDIKVNMISLFCPAAAALGFSGFVKASGTILKGKQMFVYTEVVNGNNAGNDSYNALIVAGCMRGVAWEWTLKGGVELSWSPLNVTAISDFTKYLNTSKWSSAEALQYAALGVSCSLTSEASLGKTRRTFFATDPNARIYAKGGRDEYTATHGKLAAYISDCVRYSTDVSLKDYAGFIVKRVFIGNTTSAFSQGFFLPGGKYVDNTRISTFNFNALNFEELLHVSTVKLRDIDAIPKELQSDESTAIKSQLEHLISLLNDRIEQKNGGVVSGFTLCYTGNTTEINAKADAKLGFTIKSVNKIGLGSDNLGSSASGAKLPEFIASLYNHTRAYRKSHYILQVPLIETEGSSQNLLEELNKAFVDEYGKDPIDLRGAVKLSSLWRNVDAESNNPSQKFIRFKTQETNIWYRQITTKVMEKIQLEANAMAMPKIGQQQTVGEVRLKKIKNAAPIKSLVNKMSDTKYSFINTIEYHTATAVWKAEGERLLLCKGSGRCYGQALLLNELIELGSVAQKLKPDMVSAKHEILANSLHITYNDLLAFFKSSDYRGFVPRSASQLNLNPWAKENFAAQVGCVLIESTFERNMSSSNLALRKKRITPHDTLNIAPESVLASAALPDVNPADKDEEYTLQSIRLRYRIADLKEDKTTPFKLGLYLPGTFELGIRLEEVENAGASGIVDIVTYWHGASSSGTEMYNRDQTVAATVLITQ